MTRPPFRIHGASNVILETLKRGDDDSFDDSKGATTIILRLYEAFGGHARALLHVSGAFSVAKAYSANLLEDNLEELHIFRGRDGLDDIEIKLDFRGFEVKTVKLVLGKVKHDELLDQWVSVSFIQFAIGADSCSLFQVKKGQLGGRQVGETECPFVPLN